MYMLRLFAIVFHQLPNGASMVKVSGRHMVSAEIWGRAMQRVPATGPLLRGPGIKAPEAESFFAFRQPEELVNLS